MKVGTDKTVDDLDRLLAMPFRRFVEVCVDWKEATGTDFSKTPAEKCPVHQRSIFKGRCMTTVAGIELCPVCGEPMCPKCGNHCVEQLSRITGYMSAVSSWNAAKKQELIDRQKYDMKKTVQGNTR